MFKKRLIEFIWAFERFCPPYQGPENMSTAHISGSWRYVFLVLMKRRQRALRIQKCGGLESWASPKYHSLFIYIYSIYIGRMCRWQPNIVVGWNLWFQSLLCVFRNQCFIASLELLWNINFQPASQTMYAVSNRFLWNTCSQVPYWAAAVRRLIAKMLVLVSRDPQFVVQRCFIYRFIVSLKGLFTVYNVLFTKYLPT